MIQKQKVYTKKKPTSTKCMVQYDVPALSRLWLFCSSSISILIVLLSYCPSWVILLVGFCLLEITFCLTLHSTPPQFVDVLVYRVTAFTLYLLPVLVLVVNLLFSAPAIDL